MSKLLTWINTVPCKLYLQSTDKVLWLTNVINCEYIISTQSKIGRNVLANLVRTESSRNEKTVIGGFYREWSREGKDTIPDQLKRMDILTNQFDKANVITKNVIILGDANLCSRKWNNEKFKDKTVADKLKSNMEENGLICRYFGDTLMRLVLLQCIQAHYAKAK